MQPLTDDIYEALQEGYRRQTELVLIDSHQRVINGSHRTPTRRTSILNDY